MLELLQRDISTVDDFIRGLFASLSSPLYRLMEYQLGWRDQMGAPLDQPVQQPRLHSGLCLLAAQAAGGNVNKAVPAAAAVELVYQFTQVHVDIQEGVQERHGRPSVWWVWGPAQAINAGDGLHALGRISLMLDGSQTATPGDSLALLHTLDSSCLRMLEGLHQELVYQEHIDITPDDYLNMTKAKVGALLGCACEMGAVAAGSSAAAASLLRDFGQTLGVAFQLQEDIQMLWGEPVSGKALGLDTLNKKKGFPVIYAIANGSIAQKRELGSLFFKRVLEEADLEKVIAVLDNMDTKAIVQDVIRKFYDQAVGYLNEADLTPHGQSDLIKLAKRLALRDETA